MKAKAKGKMEPQIPCSTWEFFALARDVLGAGAFWRIFGVEKSQVGRWAVNPECSADHQRNPLDRLRTLFSRLIESGEGPAVHAALRMLAEPLGLDVAAPAACIPERETVEEELLDVHPATVEHARACRSLDDERIIDHWEAEAIAQIRQASAKAKETRRRRQ